MGKYDIDVNQHKCPDCGHYYSGYDAGQHGVGKCIGPWDQEDDE